MEKIQIPNTVLSKLEAIIEKEESTTPKPKGYSEVVRYLGLEYMTVGQARKLKTFYDNYAPSDPEQREKHKMYGANLLRNFVTNELNSLANKKRISNKVRRMVDYPTGTSHSNQTGRTVDRITKPSLASVRPPEVKSDSNTQLTEEIKRIREIILLIN